MLLGRSRLPIEVVAVSERFRRQVRWCGVYAGDCSRPKLQSKGNLDMRLSCPVEHGRASGSFST